MSRILGVIVLLAIAGFSAFGFAATFEPIDSGSRLAWRIGYGLVGVACLVAAWRRARRP
jgi:hypothetical protein